MRMRVLSIAVFLATLPSMPAAARRQRASFTPIKPMPSSARLRRSMPFATIRSRCASSSSACRRAPICTIISTARSMPRPSSVSAARTGCASIRRQVLHQIAVDQVRRRAGAGLRGRRRSRRRRAEEPAALRRAGRLLLDARLRAVAGRDRARSFLRHLRQVRRHRSAPYRRVSRRGLGAGSGAERAISRAVIAMADLPSTCGWWAS